MVSDPTTCRRCLALEAEVLAAKKELTSLRNFQAAVQRALRAQQTALGKAEERKP